MMTAKRSKKVFKATAGAVALIFLCQQILWAADLVDNTIDRLNESQSQTFAPAYLQGQQATAESVVGQKQAIEDAISSQNLVSSGDAASLKDESIELQGPEKGASGQSVFASPSIILEEGGALPTGDESAFSVTTQLGDVIHYKNGGIDHIERADGTILENIRMNSDNNLVDADISYPDGTAQIVRGGKVLKMVMPDGTIINYNAEELAESIVYPDSTSAGISYIKDGSGCLVETVVSDPSKTAYYDGANVLKKVEYRTGKTIEYEGGIISKMAVSEGQYLFRKAEVDGFMEARPYIFIGKDGFAIEFGENGDVVSTAIEKDGFKAVYDSCGKLTSVESNGSVITLAGISVLETALRVAQQEVSAATSSLTSAQSRLNIARSALTSATAARVSALNAYNQALSPSYRTRNRLGVSAYNSLLSKLRNSLTSAETRLAAASRDYKIAADNLAAASKRRSGALARSTAAGAALNSAKVIFAKFSTDINTYYSANIQLAAQARSAKDNLPFIKVTYDQAGMAKEVLKTGGESAAYKDGMADKVFSECGVTSYGYTLSDLNNIERISVDRDGIKSIYDRYGKLTNTVTAEDTKISFAEDGSISCITESEGVKYLYEDKNLSAVTDEEGVNYQLDSSMHITRASYPEGRIYDYTYSVDQAGRPITVIYDHQSATYRYYRDDVLYSQVNELGLESRYEYDPQNSLAKVTQAKGAHIVDSFTYIYTASGTRIDDLGGNSRFYDSGGRICEYRDTKGNVYKYYHGEHGELVSELAELRKPDGRIVYYKDGAIDHVSCPDGVTIKNVEFNDIGKLKKFTLVLPDSTIRTCEAHDDWIAIITPDGSKLLYKGDYLVAVNTNKKLLRFRNDEIPADISLDTKEAVKADYRFIKSGNSWKAQTYSNTQAIRNALYDTGNDQLILTSDFNGSVYGKSQGEAYIDLMYPGSSAGRPSYDFKDKEIAFYVKLPDGSLPQGKSLIAQVMVKTGDPSWKTQYGTEVTISEDGAWYKVSLNPSTYNMPWGLMDPGFDPSKIRLVGLRVRTPYSTSYSYNSPIYVKDANFSPPPADEKIIDMPFLVDKESVKPYIGNMPDCQPGGNPNYISWESIPSLFYANGSYSANMTPLELKSGSWRTQTVSYSLGVTSVTRAADSWTANLNLKAGDAALDCGEAFVDLRYDIAGYEYKGPLNLTGRSLKFKVKAPQGFVPQGGQACWAQVYAKDEEYDYQYGPSVKITAAGTWYTVELIPQYGDAYPGGKTSADFDPSRIVNIGIKFSCDKDAPVGFAYNGPIYFESLTPASVFSANSAKLLIDANALKEYAAASNIALTFEQSLGAEVRLAKEHLPNYFKDDSWTMKAEYNRQGKIVWALKGNKRVEHYDGMGRLLEITDPEWGSVVTYKYDDDGDLIDIDYEGSRLRTRETIQAAQVEIESRTAQALYELGKAKNGAIQSVKDNIEPQIAQCDSALQSLYAQLAAINDWDPFWSWDIKKKNSMRSDVEHSIAQVRQARQSFLQAAADAYKQINTDVARAEIDIRGQYESSMAMVLERKTNAEVEILEQEVSQLLSVYYSKILGRNPGSEEIGSWLDVARSQGCLDPANRVAFDIGVVRQDLFASDEYADRKIFNETVKDEVVIFLSAYLNADQAGKDSMLASVGLDQGAVEELNNASWGGKDVDMIAGWMANTEMNFGRCSFETVATFLEDKGIPVNDRDLARDLILIDILSGAIDCFTEGPLKISLYAVNKYINKRLAVFGSDSSVYNSKFDFEDLVSIVREGKKAIVHLSADHYVTVTGIDAAGNVTYFDTTNGVSGEYVTTDNVTFRMSWTGYALSERAPPAGKAVSDREALQIRGNFDIFSIIALTLAIVSTALSFIDNEICQTVSKIIGVASLAFSVFSMIANLPAILENFYNGINGIAASVSKTVETGVDILLGGFKGFVLNISSLALNGIANTFAAVCYNVAFNQGLSLFNINSDIAAITTSFMTGGILMSDNFLAGGLIASTRTGISIFGRETGLDTFITDLTSTAACAMGAAFFNGGFTGLSAALKTVILPNIASEAAYVGVQELGALLGVDPRISYLAGIGLRSTVSTGLSQGLEPGKIWGGVQQGLLQGVTLLSLEWVSQKLDLPPIVGALSSAAIVGGLEALLEGRNPIEGVFDTYFKAGTGLLTLGGDGGSNPWLRAAYIAQVIDFSNIIQERGVVSALETYATGFLTQTTINEIWKKGGIADLVANNAEVVINGEGQSVKRIWVDKDNKTTSAYIDLDVHTDNFRGYKQMFSDGGYEIADCDYVVGPDGKITAKNEIRTKYDAEGIPIVRVITELFNMVRIQSFDSTGTLIGEITPLDGKANIELDAVGEPKNAKIASLKYNEEVIIKDGLEYQRTSWGLNKFSAGDMQQALTDLNLSEEDVSSIMITETRNSDGSFTVALSYDQSNRPQKIAGGDWLDIALSKDGQERIHNANHLFGYRTNAEIVAHRQDKIGLMMTDSRVGDTLIINGCGFSEDTIKIITGGPANHTSMVFVDDAGDKWIMEMPGPLWCYDDGNLRFTRVSAYAEHLNEIDCDLEIGRRNDLTAEDLIRMSSIIGDLFYNKGRTVREIKNSNGEVVTIIKDVPYNTANVFAIPGDTKRTFTCSGLIDYVYEETGKPLVDKPQLQVSPVDIRNSFEEKGEIR